MSKRLIVTFALAAVISFGAAQPAFAQEAAPAPQPAQAPEAATPPARARGERRPGQEIVVQRRGETQSKGVNVRIDATVIESRGEQVTGRKVLTITLVDGERGSVRSAQAVPFKPKGTNGYSYRSSPLNMDALAMLRDDGRIKVALTLEYRGLPPEEASGTSAESQAPVVAFDAMDEGIRQNVTVVLESGKPLIVAQSADAVGDRRVALEVKATVLK
jgi:hypothetical protein